MTISFPSYLLFDSVVKESPDSSCDEWIGGGEEDWARYDECISEDDDCVSVTNLDGEDDPPTVHDGPVDPFGDGVDANGECTADIEMDINDEDYEEWSQSSESFKAMPLEDAEFERYYHQSNWTSEHITLLGDRNNFTGPSPGYVPPKSGPIPYSPIGFFDLFWPPSFLHEICVETNRYAGQRCNMRQRGSKSSTVDEESETPLAVGLNGGKGWVDVKVQELRAWLGIKIYMGLKPLPARDEELFNCRIIPSVMTMRRWEAILRCLHLTDNEKLERDRSSPNFDKIGKVRMLLDHFVSTSQSLYNLERVVTVDELVIPYKGKYCNFRQFMREKPTRFGLKLWCLASSKSRYVYNLSVFLGKGTGKGPHGLGYTVCTEFLKPFYHRGHILVCDNFFSSPRLFHDLQVGGTWACGTVRSDRLCMPRNLKQDPDNIHRGRLIIRMHRHRQMACLSWRDSDTVFMLATAADPWSPD